MKDRRVIIINPEDVKNVICKFPGNRPAKINRALTNNIKSFGRSFNPILLGPKIKSTESVDGSILEEKEYYPVLDGQHRLLSLVELNLPLICFVDETIDYNTDKKALAALQKAKSWSLDNFVSFLSEYDDEIAIELESLILEYDQFTSTQVAEIFYDGQTKGPKSLIENGTYKLDIETGKWILDSAIELGFNATTLLRALKYLYVKNGPFSIIRLKEKLISNQIEWSANEVEVIEQILPLYNEGLYEDEMLEYDAPKKKRWFPNDVKQKALMRSGRRCEYISPDGNRCEETENLEYDHDLAFKHGGASTLENCKILCISHNRSKGSK